MVVRFHLKQLSIEWQLQKNKMCFSALLTIASTIELKFSKTWPLSSGRTMQQFLNSLRSHIQIRGHGNVIKVISFSRLFVVQHSSSFYLTQRTVNLVRSFWFVLVLPRSSIRFEDCFKSVHK